MIFDLSAAFETVCHELLLQLSITKNLKLLENPSNGFNYAWRLQNRNN